MELPWKTPRPAPPAFPTFPQLRRRLRGMKSNQVFGLCRERNQGAGQRAAEPWRFLVISGLYGGVSLQSRLAGDKSLAMNARCPTLRPSEVLPTDSWAEGEQLCKSRIDYGSPGCVILKFSFSFAFWTMARTSASSFGAS